MINGDQQQTGGNERPQMIEFEIDINHWWSMLASFMRFFWYIIIIV